MAKRLNEAKMIRDVVGERKLREAAAWFNEKLPQPFQRSHMSVKNWQDGVYKPDDVFLSGLKLFYAVDDARHQLAIEIMKSRGDAHWVGMDQSDGKKLLGVVKIMTDEEGNVIHEGVER